MKSKLHYIPGTDQIFYVSIKVLMGYSDWQSLPISVALRGFFSDFSTIRLFNFSKLVFRAENYMYSSAADYAGEKGILANVIVAK